MSAVAIVADTVSCLPPELIKEYGIIVVPIVLTINGKSYRDLIDMNNVDFWSQFDSMQSFSTAAPSPGDFMEAFKKAGKGGRDVVCALVSKALSATYQSAVQACSILKSDNYPLSIDVVDSRSAIGAEGFVVLEGARAAVAGKSRAEVVGIMQEMTERVKWINGMETTKYVIKVGRAPKTVPTEIFAQLKPMIAQLHNTGVVEDLGAAKSKEECFGKLVDTIGEYTDPGKPVHVNVHYTNNIEDGQKLAEMIKARYQVAELFLTPYSAVLCGTTGPCNAVSFYN
ncbi:MAG: DegV family protein [Dehalococcoidales bacterium]|nr:DegV family protein [Dehalococcoidales bacterium]